MKKILLSLLGLVFIAGLYGTNSVAAGSPPDIDVSVALIGKDKKTTDIFMLNEPIMVVLSMENVGPDTIISQEAFLSKHYHLELHFTYTRPDGTKELITADVPDNLDEPKPPRVKLIDGKLLQVEGVVLLESGWSWSVNPFNALEHYRIDRTGYWSVKAVIENRTYPRSSLVNFSGKIYAKIADADWEGDLKSNPGDWDKDGYYYPLVPSGAAKPEIDCNDYDAKVNPGREEIPNNGIDDDCDPDTPDKIAVDNGTINIKAIKYKLDWESFPFVTRHPIGNLHVSAYDKSPGSCSTNYGISWREFETIWKNCPTPYARMTDSNGKSSIDVFPGNYLLMAQYDPDRYIDSETDVPGNEIYIGRKANDVQSNRKMKIPMRVIETPSGKVFPCNYLWFSGSELTIIEPEYVEWDGDSERYPFVLESVGKWRVKISISPPEGFVADKKNLAENIDVNTGVKAVYFTVKDVGGKWSIPTQVTYIVSHNGKEEKIKSQVYQKLSKEKARKLSLDIYGSEIKK